MNTTFGRYRLLERLGQGGMAEVFKAKSFGVEGFEKVLVIKRILPELARSQEFVDMFVHEAKLAVRLSHANIVQVFDLGIVPPGEPSDALIASSGAYYMAMEYVHGFDLATLLTRCRRQQVPLPIDMCVYIAAEIAKGLDHAHRRRDEQLRPLNVVHRDVSPQNVLLSYEGEVKVTDFGIAKARGALDAPTGEDVRTRQLHGKYGYMSPEQASGDAVDARSDLFSLGVVLYECVAGVNPFTAPTNFETLRRVQACEYPPVELIRPDASKELVALLAMSMAKSPDDRFANAGRMYEAMLAFLYAQGSRVGGHDLADFLVRFRADEPSRDGSLSDPLALAPSDITGERTPIEVPMSRAPSVPTPASILDTGVRIMGGIDGSTDPGERRELTALVADFPERDPGDVIHRASEILVRYGGRVVQSEAGHLAAIFGLGEPDGRDTEVATRCALVMLRSLGGRGPSVGIHTARVHVALRDGVAEVTEDERLAGLVQIAHEFARVAPQGKCAISAAAMRQMRGLFELESLNEGGGQPRTGLTGSVVKDVRKPNEALGRFVGRRDELRRLGEVLASATKRRARALTVRGDHGVGKTRLLVEVERRLRKGGYNVALYAATCPPRGRDLPLSGIACMLQVLCGVIEGDLPEKVLAVQPRLRALGLRDEDVAAILNVLGATIPAANANATAALKNAFTRMVGSLCDDKPYCLAWDAAHCMDEESYAILETVLERLPETRLVLAFATRAGFSHPLEKFPCHTVLELADLVAEDAERLVATRLGVQSVPDELLRFVRDRAAGHPLFIEEVLKALVDAHAVTVADRRVVTMKLVGQELALPKTLRGLVASRVARLAPLERACLQAAAVLGDPVDSVVLAHMLGQTPSALEGGLAALEARELLVHAGPVELRFTSPIIREVVVDALTHDVARQVHAIAGRSLEAVLGDKAVEHAARIAPHFYEAGEPDHAAGYFAKSGERRIEARQLEAAVRDYARAIDLSDASRRPPEELAAWLKGLTDAVRLVRSCPDAAEICDRVLTRVDAAGSQALRVHARVNAGVMLVALHKFELARNHFAEAENVAGGEPALQKPVLFAYAEMATRQGDFNRAFAMLERLEQITTATSTNETEARLEEHKFLLRRAQSHAGLGDRKSALAALARAEQLIPEDAPSACERQKLRALLEYFSRDFRAAVIAAERAVDMARAIGVHYEIAINLHNLGDFLVRVNDFPRAYGAIRQSIELSDELGFERLASHNRMFLAFLDGVAGDQAAEALLRQGIRYAEAHDYTWDAVNGRALLAQLLQRAGETERARLEFRLAEDMARACGNRLLADDCAAALRSLAS